MGKGLAIALVLLGAYPASALTLAAQDVNDGTVLVANGDFKRGDLTSLKAAFEKARAASKPVHTVSFHSPGGAVFEALEIGRYLREQRAATKVESGRICASACVYAFLGGLIREAGSTARIGVHMHSLQGSQEYVDALKRLLLIRELDLDTKIKEIIKLNERASAQQSGRLAAYVLQMGVSIRLLEPTFKTSHDGMYWLSASELRDFNVLNSQ